MTEKTIGHFAIRDSGAPAGKTYTTLVLLHGFAWHSGELFSASFRVPKE